MKKYIQHIVHTKREKIIIPHALNPIKIEQKNKSTNTARNTPTNTTHTDTNNNQVETMGKLCAEDNPLTGDTFIWDVLHANEDPIPIQHVNPEREAERKQAAAERRAATKAIKNNSNQLSKKERRYMEKKKLEKFSKSVFQQCWYAYPPETLDRDRRVKKFFRTGKIFLRERKGVLKHVSD